MIENGIVLLVTIVICVLSILLFIFGLPKHRRE